MTDPEITDEIECPDCGRGRPSDNAALHAEVVKLREVAVAARVHLAASDALAAARVGGPDIFAAVDAEGEASAELHNALSALANPRRER